MKKKLLIMLLALISLSALAVGLTACDGGDNADESGNNNVQHVHTYTESIVDPTCTERGYTLYTCDCGYSYKAQYTASLDHDFVDGKCTRCGELSPTEGLEYTLNEDEKTYSVTGIGTAICTDIVIANKYDGKIVTAISESAFKNCVEMTSLSIPDYVSSIGKSAFYGCTNLTSLTIPNSVKTIGDYAFSGCQGLTSVTVGYGVTSIGLDAFNGCNGLIKVNYSGNVSQWCRISFATTNYYCFANPLFYAKHFYINNKLITELIIPSGVTEIGDYSFINCVDFTDVTLPDGLKIIGEGAFYSCSGLTEISIPNGVTSIGVLAFEACKGLTNLSVPGSVKTIGSNAFESCNSLISLTLNNGITKIGSCAFRFCDGLTYVNLVDSITTLEDFAFAGCNGLTSVRIGNGIKTIGDYAFDTCNKLKTLTIGNSVTYIGMGAFNQCSSLTNVILPESLRLINDHAFFYCRGLTSMIIPDMVTSIGESAFYGCTGLKSITIGNGVESIGVSAFHGCSELSNLSIGKSVKSIGERAFAYCKVLTSMTFPLSIIEDVPNTLINVTVTNGAVKTEAFSRFNSIESVVIGDGVTSIGSYAFKNCSSISNIKISNSVISIGVGAFNDTEFYNNKDNWQNGALYIDQHLIEVENNTESFVIKSETINIADYAFYDKTNLTSLTIPQTVVSIGAKSFYGCSELSDVTMPVMAIDFIPKSNLKTLNLSGGETVGMNAFQSCQKLTSVTIGRSIIGIDSTAFRDCSGIESIVVAEGNPAFYSVNNCLIATENKSLVLGCNNSVIPTDGSVVTIDWYAFANCVNLSEIIIPDSVTEIFTGAFSGCSGLKSVELGSGLTTIDDYAFYGCSGLTSLVIPNSVTKLGKLAFCNCNGLTSVIIPESVVLIDDYAFEGCYRLVEVYNLSSLNITKGFDDFGYVGKYAISIYNSLEEESKTSVTSEGFLFYTDSDKIFLLGYNGIQKNLALPQDFNGNNYAIYQNAFYKNSELKSVIISKGVTEIDELAFGECYQLEKVYYNGSEEEWDELHIGYNPYLTEATRYYYSDGQPTQEGNFWHYVGGEVVEW